MRQTALFLITGFMLSGCGLEVAGTAAVSGVNRAEEARQAQKNLENVKQKLNTATDAMQQRAAEGERAADR